MNAVMCGRYTCSGVLLAVAAAFGLILISQTCLAMEVLSLSLQFAELTTQHDQASC